MLKNIGPGFLITAAFIGPGTIITCASSGVRFGPSIFWALLVSIAITLLFQEMTARLALHFQEGLSETLVKLSNNRPIKTFFRLVILISIFLGNAAYESGNLMGATIGLSTLTEGVSKQLILFIIGFITLIVLWFGKYRMLEKIFVFLVFLMGAVFIFLFSQIDFNQIAFSASHFLDFNDRSKLFALVALIGTTVVPYNLFLHSKSITKKWEKMPSLKVVRMDLVFSVLFGGIISLSILFVFASSQSEGQVINNLADLTVGLERQYGIWARYFVSAGVLIAGLTSSLTAPMAASYAISGLFDLGGARQKNFERFIWILVVIVGIVVGMLGLKPIFLIHLAQFANGLLLPIVAIFLLYALNRPELKKLKNGVVSNILGIIVIIFLLVLGAKSILSSLNLW
jgi:manganese transport protein